MASLQPAADRFDRLIVYLLAHGDYSLVAFFRSLHGISAKLHEHHIATNGIHP